MALVDICLRIGRPKREIWHLLGSRSGLEVVVLPLLAGILHCSAHLYAHGVQSRIETVFMCSAYCQGRAWEHGFSKASNDSARPSYMKVQHPGPKPYTLNLGPKPQTLNTGLKS